MAQIPSIEISFDAPPVRVHGESVAVLVAELEQTECELYDVRGFYLEEVRLCAALSDENSFLWRCRGTMRKALSRERVALADERRAGRRREKWLGVALGAAFLLGGYVGFILGCA